MVGDQSMGEDSDDIPLIVPRKQDFEVHGQKLKKAQPKKTQRGQKKPKKEKKAEPADAVPETTTSHLQTSPDLAGREVQPVLQSQGLDSTVLPPKKSKKPRKRKDGYDPTQLAPEVIVPSAERLKSVEQKHTVSSSKVITRPEAISGATKRQQQISQLKRRYASMIKCDESLCEYVIPFTPSDPDFPYELPELLIKLEVPQEYPEKELVRLRVHSGLEVGFARNVERVFDAEEVGRGHGGRGVLGMLTWLDRNLERILAMPKSDTIKIVRPQRDMSNSGTVPEDQVAVPKILSQQTSDMKHPEAPGYTPLQLQNARTARKLELGKLRMIPPSKMDNDSFDLDLCPGLKIRLQVPQAFPLEAAWLMVLGGDISIEQEANRVLKENARGLGRTINWLVANLDKLRSPTVVPHENSGTSQTSQQMAKRIDERKPAYADYDGFVLVSNHVYSVMEDEENVSDHDDYSSGDDYVVTSDLEEDLEYMSLENDQTDTGLNAPASKNRNTLDRTQEKGTAINTVLTLDHIALLEPLSINLNLKCTRCKSTGNHVDSLSPAKAGEVQCLTCASILSVTFRGQALHAGNSRMGYLDLVGAAVLDLGTGSFSPTCEKCDTVGVAIKGLIAGQPQTRPCRACHIKQTVCITSTSFLIINAAGSNATRGSRNAQSLNLQRGHPLPDNGVCKHYRKSNRWFRFACCSRVYACDICHDTLTDHPMELARSQICGWCSRESSIRGIKPCAHCGRDLTRQSRGGAFWHGGEGTREPALMNRKDPRKHRKKIGGSNKK